MKKYLTDKLYQSYINTGSDILNKINTPEEYEMFYDYDSTNDGYCCIQFMGFPRNNTETRGLTEVPFIQFNFKLKNVSYKLYFLEEEEFINRCNENPTLFSKYF